MLSRLDCSSATLTRFDLDDPRHQLARTQQQPDRLAFKNYSHVDASVGRIIECVRGPIRVLAFLFLRGDFSTTRDREKAPDLIQINRVLRCWQIICM